MHVREAETSPLKAEGEAFVIDSQQEKQGGLKIEHVNGIAHDVVAVFVGLTDGSSRF